MRPVAARSLLKAVNGPQLRSASARTFVQAANGARLTSRQTTALPTARPSCQQLCVRSNASLPRISSRWASSSASHKLKKTQLYDLHIAHKAKMAPFAGFSMPLQYGDLSHAESHHWTRTKASLFDVSHMVQHHIRGPGALDLLMKITPSSLNLLQDNRSTLSCLLDPETGGIIDDTVITRLGPESFYVVTNAGRRAEDLEFLHKEIDQFRQTHDPASRESVINWTILDTRALVALQGPSAAAVLQPLITSNEASIDSDLSTLHFGQCRSLHLNLPGGTHTPSRLLISRTGYTGEDGFEISIPTDVDPELPVKVTELFLSNPEVRLAGLAARDSLRLEAGMCLYGHDITTSQTPPTAGLGWLVGKDRRDPSSPASKFNGASVILPQLASPAKTLTERRVGLTIESGAPAREGAAIVDLADGTTQIGVVTSGCPSPTLGGTNIAMGYVKQGMHKKGTEVGVLVRKKVRKGTVSALPFVPSKFYKG
ncbi:Aminomethyltransferase, mitochondrial [Onygenales sp. PD_40]|nr:Aminomethyltransferase, mitochondrial [Onygenales sp. PD_40]